MKKIRKGDQVVCCRRNKPPWRGDQVLAERPRGVGERELVKKHQKPNPQAGKQGGIIREGDAAAGVEGCHLEPGAKKGSRRSDAHDGKRVRSSIERRDARVEAVPAKKPPHAASRNRRTARREAGGYAGRQAA